MHRILAAAFAIVVLAAPAAAQSITAFTGATVIDGLGGRPVPGTTVIIRDSLILSISPDGAASIPSGATRIDARGKTLMPGLADMHVHLVGGWDGERSDMLGFRRYMNALLFAGVTTVHDMGNVVPYIQQLKQETVAGRLIGPRILMVGGLVDGADPVWPPISFALVSTDPAPGIVRQMKRAGADAIKAYVGLSERLATALVRAATAESLRVIADFGAGNGSDWGVRTGIYAYAHAGTAPMSDTTIRTMRARGMMNISTLAVFESFANRRLGNLRFMDDSLLTQSMPPEFATELRAYARAPLDSAATRSIARNAAEFDIAMANVRRMHAEGIPIVAGTDSPYPGVFYGEGLHRELELLVEAGLTPVEAIGAATANAARFARDTTWGTIAVGKRADLLLIDGRPHERISDTRRISVLMQKGRVLDRRRLSFAAINDAGLRATDADLSTKK